VGASGLKSVESRRVDIYVWSSVYQTYFKVPLKCHSFLSVFVVNFAIRWARVFVGFESVAAQG